MNTKTKAKKMKDNLHDKDQRLKLVKLNYKRLWEDYQAMKQAYHDSLKGLEEIERSIDSLIGAIVIGLGGEIELEKEDLIKKYEVNIDKSSGNYKIRVKEIEDDPKAAKR